MYMYIMYTRGLSAAAEHNTLAHARPPAQYVYDARSLGVEFNLRIYRARARDETRSSAARLA